MLAHSGCHVEHDARQPGLSSNIIGMPCTAHHIHLARLSDRLGNSFASAKCLMKLLPIQFQNPQQRTVHTNPWASAPRTSVYATAPPPIDLLPTHKRHVVGRLAHRPSSSSSSSGPMISGIDSIAYRGRANVGLSACLCLFLCAYFINNVRHSLHFSIAANERNAKVMPRRAK